MRTKEAHLFLSCWKRSIPSFSLMVVPALSDMADTMLMHVEQLRFHLDTNRICGLIGPQHELFARRQDLVLAVIPPLSNLRAKLDRKKFVEERARRKRGLIPESGPPLTQGSWSLEE